MTYYYICNRNIIVNSYKLFFLSSHFLLNQTKKDINLFYPLSFSSSQLNKHNGNTNNLYPPTFNPSKQALSMEKCNPPNPGPPTPKKKKNCVNFGQ